MLSGRASKRAREALKAPKRTEVLNFLLSRAKGKTSYLEIGVRNPDANINQVLADQKYSVDRSVEFKQNPVDFKLTSDVSLRRWPTARCFPGTSGLTSFFFIDGLHLAEQVTGTLPTRCVLSRTMALWFCMIVIRPRNGTRARISVTVIRQREFGNGTTWKAFLKWRMNASVYSCCVDSDWGVGIISQKQPIGSSIAAANPFFEFGDLVENRKKYLNLISLDELKTLLSKP